MAAAERGTGLLGRTGGRLRPPAPLLSSSLAACTLAAPRRAGPPGRCGREKAAPPAGFRLQACRPAGFQPHARARRNRTRIIAQQHRGGRVGAQGRRPPLPGAAATAAGEAGDDGVVRGDVAVEALRRGAAGHAARHLVPEPGAVGPVRLPAGCGLLFQLLVSGGASPILSIQVVVLAF